MTQPEPHATIAASTALVMKAAIAVVVLWAMYLTINILLLVLAALFLAAALRPWVDSLQRHHIPRPVSVVAIYAILFAVISSAVLLIVPPVAAQVKAIAQAFPDIYFRFLSWINTVNPEFISSSTTLQELSTALTTATRGVFATISDVFGGIFSFFLVLVMTFYLVVDEGAVARTLAIVPTRHRVYLTDLYHRLQTQIGRWLRAQLLLMGLVGLIVYLLLSFIGMRYALLLGLLAGLAEFIPYLGPLIGALPGVVLAYAISPTMALVVALTYWAVQLFENNVLTPKIMERAVGLSPIVSIVAFLIGAKLGGVAGAFLAIPLATAVHVIAKETIDRRSRRPAKT